MCIVAKSLDIWSMYMNVINIEYFCEKLIYYRLERAQVGTPTRTVTYRKYRCKHLKSSCIAARRLESLNMYMNVFKIEYLCEKLIYYRTERAQVGLGLRLTLTLISVRVQKATTKIV